MSDRIDELRQAWNERGERLGSTKRAVLFKRFPGWLNESIHRRHVKFVLQYCSPGAVSILDVGCGYGRISREIAVHRPDSRFQGVDLCTEFAREYEKEVGPCFDGAIQDFHSDERFDSIFIVTTLMYLDAEEHTGTLQRLWSMLDPGGSIICIEPASEFFTLWRRLTGRASASPTGGAIGHFSRQDLADKFVNLDGARIAGTRSITLIPFVAATSVHHGIAILKKDESE